MCQNYIFDSDRTFQRTFGKLFRAVKNNLISRYLSRISKFVCDIHFRAWQIDQNREIRKIDLKYDCDQL